ncbi:hypothetical protein IG631_06757 [Alternaria alternata]|nr:hypothetical protein IG631_06757 [Alternaria alternata]
MPRMLSVDGACLVAAETLQMMSVLLLSAGLSVGACGQVLAGIALPCQGVGCETPLKIVRYSTKRTGRHLERCATRSGRVGRCRMFSQGCMLQAGSSPTTSFGSTGFARHVRGYVHTTSV